MKRIFTSVFALSLVSFGFAQSQRTILAEEFTQASCGPCAAQNPAFNTLLQANETPTRKVVEIKYQTSWPGVDPMNTQTQSEVGPRVTYYNVSGVPDALMDGVEQTGASYTGAPANWTQAKIDAQYAVSSPFTITVNHMLSTDADSIYITCTITASQNYTSSGTLKGHVVMVEHQVNFTAPPGTNGETVFYGVMRKMYPNSSGTTLPSSWTTGNSQTITIAAALPNYIYDKNEIAVVAFVQDDGNKAVQQAGWSAPQPLAIDAATTALTNVPLYQCATNFTPSMTIKNTGATTLTSCTLNYQIDSNTPATQAWTGSLAAGATQTVALPSVTATAGGHIFKAWTTNPNGSPDINNVNDQQQKSFAIIGTAATAPLIEGYVSTTFPPAGWFIDNQDNDAPTWTRKTGAGGFGNSTTCAKMDFYNSPSGSMDDFYAQNVDMTTSSSGVLTFSVAYCQYSAENDALDVEVSTNCGQTWNNVYSKAGSTLSTKAAQTAAFTPTAAQWRSETVSLGSYTSATSLMIRFRATSDFGNNLYIDDVNIGTVGIEENADENGISVYPNPSSDVANVNINLATAQNVRVSIYNTLGEVVSSEDGGNMSAGSHLFRMNTSNLNSGVYFVNIQLGDKLVTKKITVTK